MVRRKAKSWKSVLPVALALIAGTVELAGCGAHAQSRQRFLRPALGAGCQLQPGGESTVLGIAGPQTLRLADGRFVRLAEVLVPAVSALPGFDPSSGASAYLRQMTVGKKVEVRFGGTQRDRYGVYMGHVYVSGEPAVWLQDALVNSGFAMAFPQTDNHACTKQLLTSEAAARDGKRGLWGLAYFKVLHANDPRSILNLAQTYQIIEGTAAQAFESGGRVTLSFGNGQKYNFTAIIEPAVKKKFAGKQTPADWAGTAMRLRGWIEKRRNPTVSITQPEQIEFLSQTQSAAQAEEAR